MGKTKNMLKSFSFIITSIVTLGFGMIIFGGGLSTVHAATPVAINSTNFPDSTFRSVIASKYDYNGDGYIDEDEVSMTMNIVCEGMGVSSIKGVEYFTDIQGLWVMDNNIDYIDVSKNVHLHGIWCSGNNITSIDLSHNPELEWIYCYDCNLTALDVSHNPEMSFIECNTNPISELDVTHNPKLEHLTCGTCELTSLDLSQNPNLAHLDAFSNYITSLDVSHNPKMKRLDVWNNPGLGSIDVSNNPGLQYYNCAYNNATSVDVSHNPELTKLICSYNELTSLDVTNNPKLVYLDCAKNKISNLDLSKNLQLRFLQAFINDFTTLDIGYNPFLVKTYNEGYKKWEYPACYGYSWTIDYGGDDSTGRDHIFFICFDEYVTLDTNLKRSLSEVYVEKNSTIPSDKSNLVTREAFAWTLYNMAGCPSVEGLTSRFNDVEPGLWYSDAIIWGEKNAICMGYPYISCDNFGVGKYLSREDAVFMLMRYSEVMGLKRSIDFGRSDDYIDYYDVDFDHWEAVCWSATHHIMEGKGGASKEEQRIDPFEKATRDECEYMIRRMQEENYLPTNPVSIPRGVDEEEVRKFVARFYGTILGREGEEDGINYWTDILVKRKQTGAQVAAGFIHSPEFQGAGYSDDVIIEKMYYAFFGREPDMDGYRHWMDKRIEGYTVDQVLSGFTDSNEFQNLCNKYGIERGSLGLDQNNPQGQPTKLHFGSNDNLDESLVEEYVIRMYTKALGRNENEISQGEIDYWKYSIINGYDPGGKKYDPASVASDGFLNSQEYINKNKSDEEFLVDCYAAFFNREPDEDGFNYWMYRLQYRGYSRKRVVLECFGTSPEFQNLLKSYGFTIY